MYDQNELAHHDSIGEQEEHQLGFNGPEDTCNQQDMLQVRQLATQGSTARIQPRQRHMKPARLTITALSILHTACKQPAAVFACQKVLKRGPHPSTASREQSGRSLGFLTSESDTIEELLDERSHQEDAAIGTQFLN